MEGSSSPEATTDRALSGGRRARRGAGGGLQLEKVRAFLHARIERAIAPLTRLLTRAGVRPNQVTVAGAVLALAAAGLIIGGAPVAAGLVWLAAGALDLVDGALARHQGRAGGLGAFLDSTLDRVSEGAMFAAVAFHFAAVGEPANAALTVVALTGSVLVSYTRARAEALGAQCKVGLATRAERVVLLTLGLTAGLLEAVIYALVLVTALTVVQRIRHVYRTLAPKD